MVVHIMRIILEVSQDTLRDEVRASVIDMCVEYILPSDDAEQERLGK